MAAKKVFLAVDLGASGGRVVAGELSGGRLELREIHRFWNGPVRIGPHLHWDLPGLWRQVQEGMRLAGRHYKSEIVSVGVDTWGVDYGLLGPNDELLGNPVHYRDTRTQGMFARAFEIVPREEIFADTGLQFMELNTLYQLLAARLGNSPTLAAAKSLLLMPDLFHWLLCGEKTNEETNASTTQLLNPQTRKWSTKLIERLGLPAHLFGALTPAGTKIGKLLPNVVEETGLKDVSVVLPGTHDTASAVVAAPGGSQGDWCYLSSGTWSLMGIESPQPVVTPQCGEWNFTNEGGVFGTTRLLKNITGLWLAQECRRIWAQQGKEYGWEELSHLAAEAPARVSVIDPDDASLSAPTDMPAAIRKLCRESGQPEPQSPGAVIRCCLESIAVRCQETLTKLEALGGRRLETIHMIGGGVQNELLCQLTADACQRIVLAGPVEATALGNVVVQAITAGAVANIAEGRELIRASFPLTRYEPRK
jgi:rhamnulokinase